jgi:DNA-binding CsgD family transcriptional regulator
VIGLAADDLTNSEFAGLLVMSRSTVKTDRSHIEAKLGRTNRTEPAAIARIAPLRRTAESVVGRVPRRGGAKRCAS